MTKLEELNWREMMENITKLSLFILCTTILSANSNKNLVDVFDMQGRWIGAMPNELQIEKAELHFFQPNVFAERTEGQAEISLAGLYLITPQGFYGNDYTKNQTRESFGFEDITNEVLPLDQWNIGDAEVEDINGDDLKDIVFCLYTSSTNDSLGDYRPRIWIQQLDGSFVDETNVRIPDMWVSSIDLELFDADMDGDTDIFLAGSEHFYMGESQFSCAFLLVNDGNGYFANESIEKLPEPIDSSLVWFAETALINNDNSFDIIATVIQISAFQVYPEIWLNDGNGFFERDTLGRLPEINDCGFFELKTADFDSDNLTDIVFANFHLPVITDEYGNLLDSLSGQNAYLRNTGDGFFSDETNLRMPELTSSTRHLTVFDIDNDNDEDIFVADFLSGIGGAIQQTRILENDGNGYFTIMENGTPQNLTGWFNDSEFGLINEDEHLDIFLTSVMPGEPDFDRLLINNGDGTFRDESFILPFNFDFSVPCELFDYLLRPA